MNDRSEGEYSALSGSGGLVAVHAHPDDETLSTGGLIATLAAAGWPVCIVTCTRGERGEVIALPGTTSEGRAGLEGDGPALGAYRETELTAAVARLSDGAIEHSFLDILPLSDPQVTGVTHGSDRSGGVRYEDSGMAWVAPGVAGPAPDSPPTAFARVPLDESAGRLAALIRARRPAVVATYEPAGGYGHPDHRRAHEVTVRALELAADPAWRPGGAGAPVREGSGTAVRDGVGAAMHEREPGVAVGQRDEPWGDAELWQAVAPAAEVRQARATLAAHPAARGLAAAQGLTFADPDEALPPLAKEGLPAWSAEHQEIGPSDYRSPDQLPITRADGVSGADEVVRVDVRPVLERVVRAMRAHATQVQHATALENAQGALAGWYALSNGVLAPILTTETYFVTPPR
ncbi:PIG-L family deacetylase [Promicromonospora panici]|uniref:PIG-L family deacetylase n=1 Tax=Promicromonospora panici TaxID=2219658 RepID=UPI001F5C6A6C|nr:PIG-L family deacetylase [Promicromonospora panici]